MKRLLIFGTGAAGEVAHYYFTREAGRTVAAFTVDRAYVGSGTFCGRPVVPFEGVESAFPPQTHDCFVAIGYSRVNRLRAGKVAEAKAKGYTLASYRSRHAVVLIDEPMGENSFILEGAIIQPFCQIGRNVVISPNGIIGHHTVVADDCYIGGCIAGNVRLGRGCFVGIGAILRDGITVGAECVIASGAVVTSDVPASSILKGSPARRSKAPSHRLARI